ncbi:hypothetical protein HMN09_00951000 [Mycena chlorophos]|uniref:Uncharacterized protein n=1 Tax=Mycena chlorophos TaxID=658473 RepID=A0A8H6SMQ6_MYCCL|nr:hypothetical protein HMN09_00951000 [Mycena chlorophos]
MSSRQVALPFKKLSLDVIMLILEMCSPLDLAELATSCPALRGILVAHPSIWNRVFANFSRGACPAVPLYSKSLEATANCTPAAYARFIFGGGLCSWCKKPTTAIPLHFLLRLRACSGECMRAISSGGTLFIDTNNKYRDHPWGRWLLRLQEKGYGGWPVYSTAMIKNAGRELHQAFEVDHGRIMPNDELPFPFRNSQALFAVHKQRELSRPALTKNAIALEFWAAEYVKEKEAIKKRNLAFLKTIAKVYRIAFKSMMRCPTLEHVFACFNRDLTLMTFAVWTQYEKDILDEYESWRRSTRNTTRSPTDRAAATSTPSQPQDDSQPPTAKVICPHCTRHFAPANLSNHIVMKHEDVDPNAFAPAGKLHCMRCPRKYMRRLYTAETLLDHDREAHGDDMHTVTCPHCTDSNRRFEPIGLKDHIAAKHRESSGTENEPSTRTTQPETTYSATPRPSFFSFLVPSVYL